MDDIGEDQPKLHEPQLSKCKRCKAYLETLRKFMTLVWKADAICKIVSKQLEKHLHQQHSRWFANL